MRLQQLLVGDALFLGPVLDRQVEIEHALQLFLQAGDVPLLGIGMLGHVLGDEVVDEGVAHVGDGLGDAVVLHQVDALVEDHLALVVLDVVELEQVLADVEVARLDLLLRLLERLVDPGVDDRLALLQAETLEHAVETIGAEDPHQIVFQRQEELRAAGVALTAGTAAQLVVDAAGFVALGADDVEAAGLLHGLGGLATLGRLDLDGLLGLQHDLAEVLDVGLDLLDLPGLLGLVRDISSLLLDAHFERAAELDVGTAAGHVGGDRDRAGHAGLGDDVGFLLVEARVQHREQLGRLAGARRGVQLLHRVLVAEIDLPVAVLLEDSASTSDFSIEAVPTRIGCSRALARSISARMAAYFSFCGAIDLVVLVEARDRHVGRDLHDLELVDVEQFVGFGQRRAGHAGELVVQAEVVLEGDRGQRLVLGLDLNVFLGLERLVQAFRIAAALHHAAGELVDDHDLVVADDVVLVAR